MTKNNAGDLKLQALARAARVLRVSERMGVAAEGARILGDAQSNSYYGAIHQVLLQKFPELLGFHDGLIPAETVQAVRDVNTAKKSESAYHALGALWLELVQLKDRHAVGVVENTKDAPHELDRIGLCSITRTRITYLSIRRLGMKVPKMIYYYTVGCDVANEASSSRISAHHKDLHLAQLEKVTETLEDYLTLAEMVREVPNKVNSTKISVGDLAFICDLVIHVSMLLQKLYDENLNKLSTSDAANSSGFTAAEQSLRKEYYNKEITNSSKLHQLDARGEQISFMLDKMLRKTAAVVNGRCVDEVMKHPRTNTHQHVVKAIREMLEDLLRDVRIEQSAHRAGADAIVVLEGMASQVGYLRKRLDQVDLELLYRNTKVPDAPAPTK